MKVAVTSTGPSLESAMDPRFGRCSYLVVVETEDMGFEAIANTNASLGGGAGIQSAHLVATKGVKTVLTGSCGPNAYQALTAAGIGVIVGCSGTVREVVERFQSGALQPTNAPDVSAHAGMGRGRRGR